MLAGVPGVDLSGLLDPSPLRGTLRRLVNFKRMARNVEDGALTAAAVVATAYATTRSVVFHHGGPALGLDSMRAIDYAATPLAPEHVLASAAIPGAFPAVEIRRPRAAAGCYGDGGVRLNAPLAPALALGADRVLVIGLNPRRLMPEHRRNRTRSTASHNCYRSRSPISSPTTSRRSRP